MTSSLNGDGLLVVRLEPMYRAMALRLAQERDGHRHKLGQGSAGTYAGKTSTREMHEHAALFEAAVAQTFKHYKATIDSGLYARGNPRGNIIIPPYTAMGVYRQRAFHEMTLKGGTMRSFRGDLAFLGWPGDEDQEIVLAGFLWRAEFKRLARTVDWGQGERLSVGANHMHSLIEFDAAVYQERTGEAI